MNHLGSVAIVSPMSPEKGAKTWILLVDLKGFEPLTSSMPCESRYLLNTYLPITYRRSEIVSTENKELISSQSVADVSPGGQEGELEWAHDTLAALVRMFALPCPFCGGVARAKNFNALDEGLSIGFMICDGCSASGPLGNEGDLVKQLMLWNKRAVAHG